MPGFSSRVQANKRRSDSLLARYSETMGEMMLRRHTEIAIRAARHEAELNHRSKSVFLSTMSHELRTPLNAIIGFSDLIRASQTSSPATSAEYAEHISKAGRRLLDVVTDVMDMSKLESGTLSLSSAPTPMGDVIESAIDHVKSYADAKTQLIEVRAERALPEADVDAKRVKQILAHLLSNAIKFTPERGRILVMAGKIADGGVSIAVADTGVGMTHEETMLALKPFTQVDSRRSRHQEGAGLGLPLELGLAQLHGGTLHIESQPGSGTTVILLLPRRGGESQNSVFRESAA